MQHLKPTSPAHKYVIYAEKTNKSNGHENLGFLSFERGFMPVTEPIEKLPYPFSKWDEVAAKMPYHYKNQSLRKAIQNLPILDANDNILEDKFLCRASMLLSMLAHAYVRNERNEDLNIPNCIIKPWEQVTKRLKRPKPFLSYIDLIIYNWKFKDPKGLHELENLNLLTPTVNNQEENVFYLTQTEIAFKTKEILNYVVEIQDAIINDNKNKVIEGLQKLKQVVSGVTKKSFLQINPNPRSATYVDPVVWAKTVAPFAVPLKEGVQGPSGTSSPFFHLIDTFIERNKYETILGKEALFIREWYPAHWRNFLNEVDKVSIGKYLEKCDDETLHGAFYDFVEAYSGDNGFLGVHRRKVYGYLQMAFKVGRSVTIGGFSGLFKERTWEEVDDELETTRLERYAERKLKCPYSGVISQTSIGESNTKSILLDTSKKGVVFKPGDRCAVVPKNREEAVLQLLQLMNLSGEESVFLNAEWKKYFNTFYNEDINQATVRKVLASAKLGNALKALDMCGHIKEFIKLDNRGQLPLLDLVSQFKRFNMDAKQYLIPYLTSILKPEEERMYSISSGFKENKIELTVGDATTVIDGKTYTGVASSYLHSNQINKYSKIPFKIISPLRFSLPTKKNVPIYLFAGGSGIAPFKGFWETLEANNELSNLSIFYSVKRVNDILFKEDLERICVKGKAKLYILVTRESKILDVENSKIQKSLQFKTIKIDAKARIGCLLRNKIDVDKIYRAISPIAVDDKKGYFYSCGKAGFALTVLKSLRKIIKVNSLSDNSSREKFYRLFSENRIMQDIFTSPTEVCDDHKQEFTMSEVVDHNNPENGYWVAIDKKVYDLTEFKEIHPGGDKIVADNAGRDATHEFRRANHHMSKEITSMLTMYCIGRLKHMEFKSNSLEIQYKDWLSSLHLTTEMLNTYIVDHSFKNRKTTKLCQKKEISPYKLALLVENQLRFQCEYVKNLKQIFKDLFYDSSWYAQIKKEFDYSIQTNVDLNLEDVQYNESTYSDRWLELEDLEQKNHRVISIIRKMLSEGIKLFEANIEMQCYEFNDAIELVLNNCYWELKTLNELELQVIEN